MVVESAEVGTRCVATCSATTTTEDSKLDRKLRLNLEVGMRKNILLFDVGAATTKSCIGDVMRAPVIDELTVGVRVRLGNIGGELVRRVQLQRWIDFNIKHTNHSPT